MRRSREIWFGQLVKPPGYVEGKCYPLIVTLYRSRDYFLVGATGNENPIQVYAATGFIVLSFSIGRNRLRRTGDFDDYLVNWASAEASLQMAVRSLIEAGIADPKKVGLAGLSRGADILEAYWELLALEYPMLRKNFDGIHERVRTAPLQNPGLGADITENEICHAIDVAAALYFKNVLCLQRSAAAACLLKKYGFGAEMVIGVQQLPFLAHAWVEVAGRVVNDKPYMTEIYSVLDRC
jgi:hypothetical protein